MSTMTQALDKHFHIIQPPQQVCHKDAMKICLKKENRREGKQVGWLFPKNKAVWDLSVHLIFIMSIQIVANI